MYMEKIDYVLC